MSDARAAALRRHGRGYQPRCHSGLFARAFAAARRASLRFSRCPWIMLAKKMKTREEDDQGEAGDRDDLVVGLAVVALAAVVGERDRRQSAAARRRSRW